MTNIEIGQRIKQRRLDMDLTQGDIANEIGVAISTIQRYETGAIDKIKLPVIEAIARVLRVSPDWLVGKSDSPLPSNIIPMPKTRHIPLIGTIACGEPILAEENLDGAGKINYDTLKPVLFEFPTYHYLKTGDVIGKCLSFKKTPTE